MKRTLPSFLLLIMVAAAGASAQKQMSLTLDQSIGLGLDNSRILHASRMGADAAEARSSEASAAQLPSLKATGSYTRLSDVPPFVLTLPPPMSGSYTISPTIVNNYNLRLTLQQPLFTGFRVQSGASMADNAAKAAGEDYNRDRSELVYAVTNAYWSLFKAIEFKKLIDETAGQVKAHLTDVQNFLAQGLATNNDVLKVQVQYSSIQLQQIDANNNVQLAMIGLNNVMGIPLETQVTLASAPAEPGMAPGDSLIGPGTLPAVDILAERALERRPELKALDYRVQAGEDGVRLARSGWFPQVYLTGNYNYARPNQRLVPTQDIFKDTWDVSLVASWDIWNWGSTVHQTHQAQAQLSQVMDAKSALRDGVRLEVTQAYLNLKQSGERIGVSRQGVEQSQENYRVTNERFKSGLALNSDLLDAEVALLQAKTSFTQSLVDYQLSAARLRKAIGQ
jgi:outer membrane protein TolC